MEILPHPIKSTLEEHKLGPVAYGTWSGGRFMHFGEVLSEEQYHHCISVAYEDGIRTFITADVYGQGRADALLGKALSRFPRDSYQLVAALGHDFYEGKRQGNTGYPRFTNSKLRGPDEYSSFLRMACKRSLERCQTDHFDLVLLHNPDEIGYTSPKVWYAMEDLKIRGMTRELGIAPGPANGFTLDLIQCFETYGHIIDWAMVILNPLEPWPASLCLPSAQENNIKVMTRVLDHGGVFFDEFDADQQFAPGDHRAYRPGDWMANGCAFVEKIRHLAEKHDLTILQYAALWNLSHPAVECVIPTFTQEKGEGARDIESKIDELSNLPTYCLDQEEVETVARIGDNTGCMLLKGASSRHKVSERCDEWPMRLDLLEIASRHGLGLDW